MRKALWLLPLLLVFLGWLLFFKPVTVSQSIRVPYSMFRSGEQLTNVRNLVKWYAPFTANDTAGIEKNKANRQKVNSGDYHAEIEDITMYSAVINAGHRSTTKKFAFTALTDSSASAASTISLRYTTSLFRKWFSKSTLEKNAEKSLENLKDFMTDTRLFYGFEIVQVPVEDTAFLFSRVTVPLSQRKEATKKVYEKLIRYAEQKNAGYNGARIYYSSRSGDEITIFASIGVSNAVETAPNGDIQYKRMPFKKNLLMTSYQGPFSQSYKAFKALEEFKTDHFMTSMAIPFQKFMSDGYEFDDEQVVQLKIYYPVF